MSDNSTSDLDLSGIQDPPSTFGKILTKIGPGLIIAGSIVGSGELIATTSTGAKAGFTLLWLIIIGCVIKVFVQVELGRFTLINGITSIRGLNMLPGPRIEGKGNWFIWYWFVMFAFIMGQLGGIVGGVGQAMSISMPLTEEGRDFNEYRNAETLLTVLRAQYGIEASNNNEEKLAGIAAQVLENEKTSIVALGKLRYVDQSVPDTSNAAIYFDALSKATDAPTVYFRDRILPLPEFGNYVKLSHQDKVDAAANAYTLLKSYATGYFDRNPTEQSIEPLDVVRKLGEDYTSLRRKTKEVVKAKDDVYYTVGLTVFTIVLLVIGRYGFIQIFSTVLVGLFTLVTIVNVFGLQTVDAATTWRITWADIQHGLSFGVGGSEWMEGLGVALATFGIIGVGAAELIAYPYWCMEQGYAKFTGPRDDSNEWAERARGWMKVLQVDAWASAAVYTFATIAFYLLGAAILGRADLQPADADMVRSLGIMYKPVFGEVAESIFLFGAIAVLYSTFFVASAGNARMFSDVLGTLGLIKPGEKSYRKSVKLWSAILPAICGITYCAGVKPVVAVLMSGLMQSIMLPMLGFAALYFRYKHSDKRVAPSATWDFFVVLSAIGLLVAGGFAAYTKIFN
ncbi:MAG: transmembrane Mn(2+) transporter [Planctomycetaceae bacterium]|nr:transmembrane Mn(2+) transporter [Planctomycetaceae bacterium]|tara:strand:+ start:344 stop:2215 length:1872 start_codon:yes stop_codon:yes gene_type:complete